VGGSDLLADVSFPVGQLRISSRDMRGWVDIHAWVEISPGTSAKFAFR
jgi:hypothetical protein